MKQKIAEYRERVKTRYGTIHGRMLLLRQNDAPGIPPVSMGNNAFDAVSQDILNERLLNEFSNYT